MPDSDILSKAISQTAAPDAGASNDTNPTGGDTPSNDDIMGDGTVTVPPGILPEETKEGDIIQMNVILKDEHGIILKPVESRIKQPGADAGDVKAMGLDNSTVGTQPDKMAQKPQF